jgi:hypothetical protein
LLVERHWRDPLPGAAVLEAAARGDLLSADSAHVPERRACKIAANDPARAEVQIGLELPPGTDEEHRPVLRLPLLVDAAARGSRSALTTAFGGVRAVGEAIVVNRADCCILTNASAPIGPDNVAGLDDQRACCRRLETSAPIRLRDSPAYA